MDDHVQPAPRALPHALAHVEALQRDGLLLLAHLAEAPASRLASGDGADPKDEVDPDLLISDPAGIAANPARLAQLLQAVDLLGRAAAPATVNTIRLTNAFLDRKSLLPEPPGQMKPAAAEALRRAGRLRWWIRWMRCGTLLAVLVVLGLLMHVDNGRRIVAQHVATVADLGRSYAALAKLDREQDFEAQVFPKGQPAPERRPALTTMEMCWPVAPGQLAEPDYFLIPVRPLAQDACSLLWQQKIREQVIFARLESWNCAMRLLNPYHLARWLRSDDVCRDFPHDLGLPAREGDWRRTELRTQDGITQLTGYVLPLLLGGIGGAISVLRNLETKLRGWTLSAHDGVIGFGRILLATIFGGLLGLVFGTSGDVQLGGFSLSLAAWAFILGYALERALKVFDSLIDKAIGRLSADAPKPAAPVAIAQ